MDIKSIVRVDIDDLLDQLSSLTLLNDSSQLYYNDQEILFLFEEAFSTKDPTTPVYIAFNFKEGFIGKLNHTWHSDHVVSVGSSVSNDIIVDLSWNPQRFVDFPNEFDFAGIKSNQLFDVFHLDNTQKFDIGLPINWKGEIFYASYGILTRQKPDKVYMSDYIGKFYYDIFIDNDDYPTFTPYGLIYCLSNFLTSPQSHHLQKLSLFESFIIGQKQSFFTKDLSHDKVKKKLEMEIISSAIEFDMIIASEDTTFYEQTLYRSVVIQPTRIVSMDTVLKLIHHGIRELRTEPILMIQNSGLFYIIPRKAKYCKVIIAYLSSLVSTNHVNENHSKSHMFLNGKII